MNSVLLAIIGFLLIYIAWQQYRHELWVTNVVERLTPPPVYRELTPPPRPLATHEILGLPPEPVYLLDQPLDRQRTRQSSIPIHPRFENYGVEISFAPTIGVT